MKRYTLSFADSVGHIPEYPERTCQRSPGWDVQYQVWPSAGAMETTLRMQGKAPPSRFHWVPWRAPMRAAAPE
jgi:hypothetical protein